MTTVRQAAEDQQAGRAVAVQQATTMRQAIKASQEQFALALPKHVDSGRFMRAALTAMNVVPKLAECTQQSVLAGLMQAAQLGLEVADVRGQAYLIPRKVKGQMQATFQLGFRGMIDLAARGGITVTVDEICENDEYDYQRGTRPFLRHKPRLSERGAPVAYYAVGTFADSREPAFVIMGRGEVEEHRDKFASTRDYNTKEISGPWVDHFDAMARKTVVRKLLNYLPATVELRQAEAIETSGYEPVSASYGVAVVVPDGIDAVTGEMDDPTLAIEATGTDQEPAA